MVLSKVLVLDVIVLDMSFCVPLSDLDDRQKYISCGSVSSASSRFWSKGVVIIVGDFNGCV